MNKVRTLFAASEVFPFAKSGGLADVAYSLPKALSLRYDVTVVLPLYKSIKREVFGIVSLGKAFDISMGGATYPVELYGCVFEEITHCFVYSELLCEREFMYGPAENGYIDNAVRFAIFDHAILEILKSDVYALAHLNDWQTALIALLVHEDASIKTKTLYTIHNLAYQGVFEPTVLKELGIDERYFTMEGIEFYDQVNLMKAGIAYADAITTVSPTYAKEILTPEFGCGLEGFLQHHKSKLVGILNGIDKEHFSPSNDKDLVETYSDMKGKSTNKKAYLKHAALDGETKPLLIFIGRFTWQKGIDLLIESLPEIASMQCTIAILGEGEAKYQNQLQAIANDHPNVYLEVCYDEARSHQMYAAADFLLMPSLFEPCGLNQMIAMHYGTIPIVHNVGGLANTVHEDPHINTLRQSGFGIMFCRPTKLLFTEAVERALELYSTKRLYNKLVRHNMQCDFSWSQSALAYETLYERLLR